MMFFNRTILSVLSLSGLLASCSNSSEPVRVSQDTSLAVPVRVSIAGDSSVAGDIEASGQIESVQSAAISTRVMGYITQVYVKTGDRVKRGQLLFAVNSSDLEARKAQAEANIVQAESELQNAQKDFDRFTVLYKQQSASAKELDNITLRFNAAKAGLEAARQGKNEVLAQFSYTRVTAPFAGTITQKDLDAGNMASPGMPVVTLEEEGLQVSASIPETRISAVKYDSDVRIIVKSIGKEIKGKISQISQSSQTTGSQYIVKISIPPGDQKGLFSGMYVNLSLPASASPTPAKAGIMVPLTSIVYHNELAGLYSIGSNHQALLRWVRLGKTYGDKVEVLSGLDKSEAFILQPDPNLYSGAPVRVIN